jgi:hypothetical protein
LTEQPEPKPETAAEQNEIIHIAPDAEETESEEDDAEPGAADDTGKQETHAALSENTSQ